jgi:diguanylate cyclase (GGDEF)-like protein
MRLSKRDSNLLAFVLIDIDHFKQYNDTYGHQDGDTTLKSVALALKNVLKRPNDYTFRLGGEEFGMLYHVSKVEDAVLIANKARESIENLKIAHEKNSASDYVTISGGLYIMLQDDESKPDEIYKMADELLYSSKQNGRNQITANLCTS